MSPYTDVLRSELAEVGITGRLRTRIADALACLAGFATLGRYLGLWIPGRRAVA